ncbi:MAG: rhamnulokinase [Lachnospiraceae bacterium]|nr:rhamnulokinase [Lachnospiraceae bacterium]
MQKYYLAVDIGASSGRHILVHMEQDRMVLEEIHRFPNRMVEKEGELCWDVEQLFQEIKAGMRACADAGKIPVSMGIDTWGVDFVLLNKKGGRIGNAVAYRDRRTEGMDQYVYQVIPEEELYLRTGIQKQQFNTIYQLMALKQKNRGELFNASALLMIPDYFHYLLTGVMANEYTVATTSQFVDPVAKQWDMELIQKLGFNGKLFQKILPPGSVLGELTEEIRAEVGFSCKVVLPASHDTASAVMAVPAGGEVGKTFGAVENPLYISSGTWSLLGTELTKADCSKQGRLHNFTNEGGYAYRFRYLKNIMGLWMIQSVKKEIGKDLSFGQICSLAEKEEIASVVDCNDKRFLNPQNMTREVQKACAESGQQVPKRMEEVAAVIYRSLAVCYAQAVKELENLTGKCFERIHIVGGGSNADWLNRLTADASKKYVLAGSVEATAVGNAMAQMLADGVWDGLYQARECVSHSFPVRSFWPGEEEKNG